MAVSTSFRRLPVYFLSIGGPNSLFDTTHPSQKRLEAVGREITTKIRPRAVVVFSAHWQDSPNRVQINVAEHADIIYDFYGFPSHYYEYQYPNKGSTEIAERVAEKLAAAGIKSKGVERGLDHGVYAGFGTAFHPKRNPLNVPIVQVSLFWNEDIDQHYRLGQALQSLREEGILIIGAGMAAHNLPDFRAARGDLKPKPYTITFEEALKDAVAVKPEVRQTRMTELLEREDAREAHPTLDHLLPMYICAGAAGPDVGERLWTFPEGSMNWAQYRFGEVTTV